MQRFTQSGDATSWDERRDRVQVSAVAGVLQRSTGAERAMHLAPFDYVWTLNQSEFLADGELRAQLLKAGAQVQERGREVHVTLPRRLTVVRAVDLVPEMLLLLLALLVADAALFGVRWWVWT